MQKAIIFEPTIDVNLRTNLHVAWSKVQAALTAMDGDVRCTELTFIVLNDEPTDSPSPGSPLVAQVTEALGEPISAHPSPGRKIARMLRRNDGATIWNLEPDADQLSRCYAWVRTHEREIVDALHQGRVSMDVEQEVALTGGGWVRITTKLNPIRCTAVIEACVHGDGVQSPEFTTVWHALQASFGTIKTDSLRKEELDEDGDGTGSIYSYAQPHSLDPLPKFKASKDPFKKPPAPKRPKFLLFDGPLPLPGDTPAERLASLDAVIQALGETLTPTRLELGTYEDIEPAFRENLVQFCGVPPLMQRRSIHPVALKDGQRSDLVSRGKHTHNAPTLAAVAKHGEPSHCAWRANRFTGRWDEDVIPDCVRWVWRRDDHSERDAFAASLVPGTLPDIKWPYTRLEPAFEGTVSWSSERISVRAVIGAESGVVHIEFPLLAKPGDDAFTAFADRLYAVVGERTDTHPRRRQWKKASRDAAHHRTLKDIKW